jgi:hypothetical protein
MPEVRQSTPPSTLDKLYIEEFAKEKIKQGDRFDELYKILFNIELAALSAYLLLLRFFVDSELNIEFVYATIVFWLIALAFTVYGFFPKYYKNVMANVVQRQANQSAPKSGKYTILEYYDLVATHKKQYIFLAISSFCVGLIFIALTFTYKL